MMSQTDLIHPGERWRDTDGQPIQAHGGGIIEADNAWYWFGEDKSAPTILNERGTAKVPFQGIACYRSTDLITWQRISTALSPVPDDPDHPLHTNKVVERPKVLFDPHEQRYVMWCKMGGPNYEYMHLGVATSKTIAGPYQFIEAKAPNDNRAGDFALLRDRDGTAYIIHPTDKFKVMIVAELDETATRLTGNLHRCLEGDGGYHGHEAPTLFDYQNRWYMLTSRVSGWKPNPCRACVADQLAGPWTVLGELCDIDQTETTFDSQPACIWPYDPARGRFIYIGDRWNTADLGDSRYIWLPIVWKDDIPHVRWLDAWHPEDDAAWVV